MTFRSLLSQCCHGYKVLEEDVPAPLVIANPLACHRSQPRSYYQGNRWYAGQDQPKQHVPWYGSTGAHHAMGSRDFSSAFYQGGGLNIGQPGGVNMGQPGGVNMGQPVFYPQQPPHNHQPFYTVHSAGSMGYVYETRLVQSGLVIENQAAEKAPLAAVEAPPRSGNITKARRRRGARPTPTTAPWEPAIRRPTTIHRPLTTTRPSYIVELTNSNAQTEPDDTLLVDLTTPVDMVKISMPLPEELTTSEDVVPEVVVLVDVTQDVVSVEDNFQKLVLERSCSRPEDILADSMEDVSPSGEVVASPPGTPDIEIIPEPVAVSPPGTPDIEIIPEPVLTPVRRRRVVPGTPMSPILTAGFEWCEDYEYELVECHGDQGEEEEEEGALELEPNFELDSPFNQCPH